MPGARPRHRGAGHVRCRQGKDANEDQEKAVDFGQARWLRGADKASSGFGESSIEIPPPGAASCLVAHPNGLMPTGLSAEPPWCLTVTSVPLSQELKVVR
jgi:hypothetical protein